MDGLGQPKAEQKEAIDRELCRALCVIVFFLSSVSPCLNGVETRDFWRVVVSQGV